MSRKYHSVLTRDSATDPWAIHFGDYDRQVAVDERDDLVDEYGAKNVKLITTGDAQSEIEAAVAKLNA